MHLELEASGEQLKPEVALASGCDGTGRAAIQQPPSQVKIEPGETAVLAAVEPQAPEDHKLEPCTNSPSQVKAEPGEPVVQPQAAEDVKLEPCTEPVATRTSEHSPSGTELSGGAAAPGLLAGADEPSQPRRSRGKAPAALVSAAGC